MRNKTKIIVTGGLGFIGSNLISLLIKKNFNVINIDKVSYSSNFYNVREFKNNNKYKFIKCDIGNKNKIFKILKKENLRQYLTSLLKHMLIDLLIHPTLLSRIIL